VVEGERAALEQILEPAGAGDDDVGTSGTLGLGLDSDASIYRGDRKGPRLADGFQFVDDLAGQLPGGGEDQCGGATGIGGDQVDERHAEGERLAGAGRRLDEDVPAVEHVFDHLSLNCERGFESTLCERIDYGS